MTVAPIISVVGIIDGGYGKAMTTYSDPYIGGMSFTCSGFDMCFYLAAFVAVNVQQKRLEPYKGNSFRDLF